MCAIVEQAREDPAEGDLLLGAASRRPQWVHGTREETRRRPDVAMFSSHLDLDCSTARLLLHYHSVLSFTTPYSLARLR